MDEELICKARNGDRDALNEIFTPHFIKSLYVLAKCKMINQNDVEDVVQEVLLETFKNLYKLRDAEKFKNWTKSIIRNKIVDACKYDKNKPFSFEDTFKEVELEASGNDFGNIDDRIDLFNVFKCLTIEEEQLILMYADGYTTKDMAIEFNMNENTVRTNISRIKKKIRKACNRGDIDEGNDR